MKKNNTSTQQNTYRGGATLKLWITFKETKEKEKNDSIQTL